MPFNTEDAEGKTIVMALRQGLEKFDWIEGRNIRIDFRFGGGDVTRTQIYARELVGFSAGGDLRTFEWPACPAIARDAHDSDRLRRRFGPRRGRLRRKFRASRS